MVDPILAAHRWVTNGDMISDVHRLGYLLDTDWILDPTFGKGSWWRSWQPHKLTHHDIAQDGVSFTNLPYASLAFDVVAYDPPYVAPGGRKTSTITLMHDRYGMLTTPKTPEDLQFLINRGLSECARVAKRYVLVKCMDYVSSGHYWNGTYHTQRFAFEHCDLEQIDRFELVGDPGPQPTLNRDGTPRRQVHARRNLSTLFVFGHS